MVFRIVTDNRPHYSFAELAKQADALAESLHENTDSTPSRSTVDERGTGRYRPKDGSGSQSANRVATRAAYDPPPRSAALYEIDVHDGRIWARTEFKYKDHLKAIAGAAWHPASKHWHFPADVTTATRVARAVPDGAAIRTPAFHALLETGQRHEAERARLMRAEDDALPPIPITKLAAWGHQKRAYWAASDHDGYLLAMDMGTGKSKVAIDEIQNAPDEKLIFIGCPKSVVGVWPREFAKHALNPDRFRIVALRTGSTEKNLAQAKQALALAQAEKRTLVLIINYESAWREAFAKWALSIRWDRVIADESHRIKSARGVASLFFEKLGKKAVKRRALTGTPMAHTPLDVFAQFRFIDPTIYGTNYTSFKRRYGAWGGYEDRQLVGILNEKDLNERFYSRAYRVGKEVLDLPAVMPDITRDVLLSLKARKLYHDMATEFVAWTRGEGDFEHAVTASNALAKLTRLQQITSGYLPSTDDSDSEPYDVFDSAKEDALADFLEDLDEREPVVVFCRWRADLDAIKRVTAKLKRRYGELSGRDKGGLTETAEMSPDIDILGAQIASGGVGIDLTRARYCVYYSTSYSLADYDQSKARTDRPGQTRRVQYVYLRAPSTVDDDVINALRERKDVVNAVLNLKTLEPSDASD